VSEAARENLPRPPAARASFPRSVRLLRHSDFEQVYKLGKRHFAAHVTVFYLPREERKGVRFGFTVGKFLGGAVERNRIKRRIREAVRLHKGQMSSGVDVVINPKKSALKARFTELQRDITRALEVIGKCD